MVQGATRGDELLVFTGRDSWKIKRIRNDPQVTVAAYDSRRRKAGDPVDAVAALLPDSETEQVYRIRLEQNGLLRGLVYRVLTRLDGGLDNRAVLRIRPAA